jgi:competence ComEA-like helix-hairpin-helix protein
LAGVVLAGVIAIGVLSETSIPVPDPAEANARRAACWPDMRIDVNRATAAELRIIPGIGPTLAARIVADRLARGEFRSMDDLMRVPMVGPALIRDARSFAVVVTPVGAPS